MYDVIVIGGGLSGLTAASLCAKRNLRVLVLEKSYQPGGSCGAFKRGDVTFDQGTAMLFGFGQQGFNPHRFVFNCLEEPINMIKHEHLYCMNYRGKRIIFHANLDDFSEELGNLFSSEKKNIKRFFDHFYRLYSHVMIETPMFTSPDEIDKNRAKKQFLKHPLSYLEFLGYMNKSTETLLKKYFTDPEIFQFFDKLTSTYCYTTTKETPAVLGAVMFVDNHVGGSYYPAGSTLHLPGKLEKTIEDNGGEVRLESEVIEIKTNKNEAYEVILENKEAIQAKTIIYSGTVWNLYQKLLANPPKKLLEWSKKIVPTMSSNVLYLHVKKQAIPEDALPIEMMASNPEQIDEGEITCYCFSLADQTLTNDDTHTIVAIGPSLIKWDNLSKKDYLALKDQEANRMIQVISKRFTNLPNHIISQELATPKTIERYTLKNNGSVAGPKQFIGQHMLKRQHTKTAWNNLFCCGESTVMGTGSPSVTVSGISAANAVLKKLNKEPFFYDPQRKNVVNIISGPFLKESLFQDYPKDQSFIMKLANQCWFCESPSCRRKTKLDVRTIMRKIVVGNFLGAKKLIENRFDASEDLLAAEIACIQCKTKNQGVKIKEIIEAMREMTL
jgi:prolycopene isomerase